MYLCLLSTLLEVNKTRSHLCTQRYLHNTLHGFNALFDINMGDKSRRIVYTHSVGRDLTVESRC